MLKCFSILGNDFSPSLNGFSHSFGLAVFDDIARKLIMVEEDHFLEFVLKMYEKKYACLRNFSNPSSSSSEKILDARIILKSQKGCERENIPLPSCLKFQVLRAEYLLLLFESSDLKPDPSDYGYMRMNNVYHIKIQDKNDDFYSLPLKIMEGCACKALPKCSNRCKCLKTATRGNLCCRITCKVSKPKHVLYYISLILFYFSAIALVTWQKMSLMMTYRWKIQIQIHSQSHPMMMIYQI